MAKISQKKEQHEMMTKIDVTITGLSGIMFDRFIDHSKEIRPPEQKLYYDSDGKTVVIPSMVLESFITRQLAPVGCGAKFEGKRRAEYASMALSHVFFSPELIPIIETKTKKPVLVTGELKNDDRFYITHFSPITKMSGGGAIKQEAKPRPVLRYGWELSFEIQLIKNQLIDENKLYNWFSSGGIVIGLGSYRPRYGRFEITKWEIK